MIKLRLSLYLTILAGVAAAPRSLRAQKPDISPQYVHDHIVAIIARSASRAIAPGDTFVGWWPNPVLYTTVHRSGDTVESSLVRVDSMVGTAQSVWDHGYQRRVSILWTQRDSILLRFDALCDSNALHIGGGKDSTIAAPTLRWAVADYGMDDQLLPLMQDLARHPSPQRIAVFHPVANKWDTVSVALRRVQGAVVVDITNDPADIDHWIITVDGALVRITRDKYPDLERRPLELTARMADYLRLRFLTDSRQSPR
jgi:hypothetical protein